MDKKELLNLTEKIGEGNVSEADLITYNDWFNSFPSEINWQREIGCTPDQKKDELFKQIKNKLGKTRSIRLWPIISTAAAAIVFILLAVLHQQNSKIEDRNIKFAKSDVAPGSQGATLYLADGKSVRLSGKSSGKIAQELGVSITKTADGLLLYEVVDRNKNSDATNMLVTARGETYIVVLPDKSKVWLNADSKLTYPSMMKNSAFRKVKLSGEAYFEVAKDIDRPFIVESQGQEVRVLGTHFNIKSYADENSTITTLLEGKVKVATSNHKNVILSPGQQTLFANGTLASQQADVEQAVAWKNGDFIFNDESLYSIMTQISRWYNVEVEYQDPSVSKKAFGGTISKFKNVSDVLRMLELTGEAHFKIKERRIIVTK